MQVINPIDALKDRLRGTALYEWRTRREGRRTGPRISASTGALSSNGGATFVVICGGIFDQSTPNAATTMRMGWCRGFEALGLPYVLVSAFDLVKTLPEIAEPICWIAGSDYVYLDRANLACLKSYRHAVLVSTFFKHDSDYYSTHGFPQQSWPKRLRNKILSSEPAFVFSISPESRFEFYEGWIRAGQRLVSLPLACDTSVYESPPHVAEFEGVEIAFVGGYWPYKARQFDEYLRPFADLLHVYGYSSWPYGKYRGRLLSDREGALYAQAKVSPIINEPHAAAMGVDINERVFKVLGSGGLGLTDATPGYRDWFSAEELLVPRSVAEYGEMLRRILADPASFARFRDAGCRAVLERHTYRHRAARFAELLGLTLGATADE